MSNIKYKYILKMLENMENNSIKLENDLFNLSSEKSQIKTYNELLQKQKELFSIIKNLNIKEELLNKKEEELSNKEKNLNKKELKINQKEKELKEEEIRIKKGLDKNQEKKLQKILYERKKQMENIINNTLKSSDKIEQKKLCQDISNLGKMIKEEMNDELEQNPDKFIDISKALSSTNSKYFPLAVLANNLEKEGILVLLEKDGKASNLQNALFKCIFNGIANQKKIIISYELDTGENHMILNNDEYRENFIEKEYDKISNILKISKEYLYICNFDTDSVKYELFINEKFVKKNMDDESFVINDSFYENIINKLNEYSSSENIKMNVQISPIIEAMKLNIDLFDFNWNKSSNWSQDETRGGLPYDPPIGWSGYGLKVLNKYEDNDWLGNTGEDGEWCVAYYNTDIINFSQSLLKSKNLPSKIEAHQGCNNKNKKCSIEKVGLGIYVTPKIQLAEENTASNNDYKCIFMCRINPEKFRTCDLDCWVVDQSDTDIRPYKLLIKKCS